MNFRLGTRLNAKFQKCEDDLGMLVAQLPRFFPLLIRKETRLTELQLEQLTILARKLNRQRRGGERITENTLIRVAIDLLLSRSDELSGTTEAELRSALGLKTTE